MTDKKFDDYSREELLEVFRRAFRGKTIAYRRGFPHFRYKLNPNDDSYQRLGVNAAVLLSQMFYWWDKGYDQLYKKWEDIWIETGLTRQEQRTARQKLVDAGLITERKRSVGNGKAAEMCFTVIIERVVELTASLDPEIDCSLSNPLVASNQYPIPENDTHWLLATTPLVASNHSSIIETTDKTKKSTLLPRSTGSTQSTDGKDHSLGNEKKPGKSSESVKKKRARGASLKTKNEILTRRRRAVTNNIMEVLQEADRLIEEWGTSDPAFAMFHRMREAIAKHRPRLNPAYTPKNQQYAQRMIEWGFDPEKYIDWYFENYGRGRGFSMPYMMPDWLLDEYDQTQNKGGSAARPVNGSVANTGGRSFEEAAEEFEANRRRMYEESLARRNAKK